MGREIIPLAFGENNIPTRASGSGECYNESKDEPIFEIHTQGASIAYCQRY